MDAAHGIHYNGDKGPKFGVRHVQILMMCMGMGLMFMSNTIFSVAIVAMTDNSTSKNPNVPTYNWNNTGVMISVILWSGLTISIFSGYLGTKFGPKWFMVGSSFLNWIFFALIPLSAQTWGSTGVIGCRLLQGFQIGFFNPLYNVVAGRWVPPGERSRAGFLQVGFIIIFSIISNVATGYIASSDLGWPWVYYIFGVVGLIWTVVYGFIGAQSVETHPRISFEEKRYIQITLFVLSKETATPTPWKQILTCIHVWASLIGDAGYMWLVTIVTSVMSIFMAKVMKYDIESNVLVVGLPPIVGLLFGILISILSDMFPKKRIMSVVNSRRFFHLIGVSVASISLISITFLPLSRRDWTPVLFCIVNMFMSSPGIGGAAVNLLDVTPKYAGIISGLGQVISQAVSLFAPLTFHWICTDESDAFQWRLLFITTAAVSIGSATFFCIFASDKRQIWDPPTEQEEGIESDKILE